MALTGPVFEEIVAEAVSWYQDNLLFLMRAMEEGGHPYGAVRLSPAEQVAKYLTMTEEDWSILFALLERRFQGLPNSRALIEDAATRYVKRMETLRSKVSDVIPSFQQGQPVGLY